LTRDAPWLGSIGERRWPRHASAALGLGNNESYPDLFQPQDGFPYGVKVESGCSTQSPLPGIGFEGKSDFIAELRALAS